jgi:hypothetical protein
VIVVGMAVLWGGYALASWGYVLVKGWNIPLRAWVSPLHPYQWPGGGKDPEKIPQGKVWPTAAAGATTAAAMDTASLQQDVTPGAA